MSGIKSSNFTGNVNPHGVPNPTQKAVAVSATATPTATPSAFANLVYSRRYLDWNRLSFAYHAIGSQSTNTYNTTFDYHSGLRVTKEILDLRNQLNLTKLYGCAPQSYCFSCQPFGAPGNIFPLGQYKRLIFFARKSKAYFPLVSTALSATVINSARSTIPRLILINTGSIRFDLIEGPFTFDDSFIVSPFTDKFQYIPNVPYSVASQVLNTLNNQPDTKKRDLETRDFGFTQAGDSCVDAVADNFGAMESRLTPRSTPMTRGKHRRQTSTLTPGYVTTDDFGTDGDDTIHSMIPSYPQPQYVQANGSLPTSAPATVDLIFLDFIASNVLQALTSLGAKYTTADVQYYLPASFTLQSYLPAYAQIAWQKNVPNCPVAMQ